MPQMNPISEQLPIQASTKAAMSSMEMRTGTSLPAPDTIGVADTTPLAPEPAALPNPAEQASLQEANRPGRIRRAARYMSHLIGTAIDAAPGVAALAEEIGVFDWAEGRAAEMTGNMGDLAQIGLRGARRAAQIHRERMAQALAMA